MLPWYSWDNIVQEKILFSIVLILLGKHYTGKNPAQCCLNTLGTTLHTGKTKLFAMLPKRHQTTLHRKKILFIVVLIVLGQHCTGKDLVQFSLSSLRQHCAGKKPARCCFNTLEQHCIGKMSRTILCMLPSSRQHCTEKSCSMLS